MECFNYELRLQTNNYTKTRTENPWLQQFRYWYILWTFKIKKCISLLECSNCYKCNYIKFLIICWHFTRKIVLGIQICDVYDWIACKMCIGGRGKIGYFFFYWMNKTTPLYGSFIKCICILFCLSTGSKIWYLCLS